MRVGVDEPRSDRLARNIDAGGTIGICTDAGQYRRTRPVADDQRRLLDWRGAGAVDHARR